MIAFPFPCCPVNHERLQKKIQIEKKRHNGLRYLLHTLNHFVLFLCFFIWDFFHKHLWFVGQQSKKAVILTPLFNSTATRIILYAPWKRHYNYYCWLRVVSHSSSGSSNEKFSINTNYEIYGYSWKTFKNTRQRKWYIFRWPFSSMFYEFNKIVGMRLMMKLSFMTECYENWASVF